MRAALVELATAGAVAEQCPVVAALVGD